MPTCVKILVLLEIQDTDESETFKTLLKLTVEQETFCNPHILLGQYLIGAELRKL